MSLKDKTAGERKRRYRIKNREKHLSYSRIYNNKYYKVKRVWTTIEKKYGITREDFEEILRLQGGRCAICGQKETQERKTRLSVDHNHESGLVRGLLCDKCNRGLGCFNDDINMLKKAMAYLLPPVNSDKLSRSVPE